MSRAIQTVALRVGASVAALVLVNVALTPVLYAQELPGGNLITPPPQEVHVTNTTVVQVPPFDSEAVSEAAGVANQSLVVNTIQPVPVQWVNSLCAMPNIWTTTPPEYTYGNADIASVSAMTVTAALALSGLALAGIGLVVAFNGDAHRKLGRLALAASLAVGNLLWWEWGIKLNNALTGLISPPDFCGALIHPNIALQTPDVGTSVATPVLTIVSAVVALMVLISLAFRLGMLEILIVAGPIAMFCWATEWSKHIAHWYQRLAIGTLFGQVLFVIGLRTAHALSSITAGLAGSLMAIVVLLLCRKLLGALSSQQIQNGGSSTGVAMAMLVRRLVFKFI